MALIISMFSFILSSQKIAFCLAHLTDLSLIGSAVVRRAMLIDDAEFYHKCLTRTDSTVGSTRARFFLGGSEVDPESWSLDDVEPAEKGNIHMI